MKTKIDSIMTMDTHEVRAPREMRTENGELKSRFFYKLVESGSVVWTSAAEKIVLELMDDRWKLQRELKLARALLASLCDDSDIDAGLDSVEDLAEKFGVDCGPVPAPYSFGDTLQDLRLEQSELH